MELKVKQVQRVDGAKEALYLPALFGGLRITVRHFWRNLFGAKDVVTVICVKPFVPQNAFTLRLVSIQTFQLKNIL